MDNLPDEQKGSSSPPTGTVAKEKEAGLTERLQATERIPIVEMGKISETQAEQEGYIERVEKEIELDRPITDGQGQILVTSPAAQQPKIVLPISRQSYFNPKNWHQPVTFALRWLLALTKRIIKMYPGRTTFSK
jgi:hypothetical protein